jgi:hypothetical protein
MQTDALFSEALFALASGAHDEAVARLRAVRSKAQESGDVLAAASAYVALISANRQRGDERAQGADLRALERAALNLPGSAFEEALRLVSSRRLASMDELDAALFELGGL